MTDHEPMPITNLNSTPVQASAISRFIGVYHAQWAQGKEKYGTDLMTFNGRDAANDALQELADLLAYLVQLSMEYDALAAENAELRRDKLRLVNACEVACIGLAGVTNGEDPRLAIEAAGAACCRAMQGVGMPDGLEEVVASLEVENETLREDAEVIHEIREIIQSFNEKMKVPPYSLVHGGLDNYQTAITGISAALEAAGLMEREDNNA